MAKQKSYRVGFDLGGTKMMAAVFDADFEITGRRRRKTKGQQGAEAGLERIVQTIEQALDEAGVEAAQLAGIGVGSPGPLDLNRGVMLDLPNVGWRDVPLRDTLQKHFGCPVAVANDVDTGLFGEYRFGAAKGARCAVGVFPGTGIGGGCVYEGRLMRGAMLSCMEIGHMNVVPDGQLCGCGRRGCLETVASRLAIASAAAAAAYRGEAPHLFEKAGADLTRIRSGALADAMAAGDEAVERIVRNAVEWLGAAMANVVNLLTPDVIVLGGGLVEAMPDLFVDGVRTVLDERVMPSFVGSYEVRAAALGDDATVRGAAALAAETA